VEVEELKNLGAQKNHTEQLRQMKGYRDTDDRLIEEEFTTISHEDRCSDESLLVDYHVVPQRTCGALPNQYASNGITTALFQI
jgi:hypothetical protein